MKVIYLCLFLHSLELTDKLKHQYYEVFMKTILITNDNDPIIAADYFNKHVRQYSDGFQGVPALVLAQSKT